MQLDKYLTTSAAVLEVSRARQIGVGKHLLDAIEIRRDEIRHEMEGNPMRSDVIKKDVAYLLGMVAAFNWVMDLPKLADQWIKHLEDSQGENR